MEQQEQPARVPHYRFVAMIPGTADYAGFEQRVNELLARGWASGVQLSEDWR